MHPVYRLLSDIIVLIETGVPRILFILCLALIYLALSGTSPTPPFRLNPASLHVTFTSAH